MLKVLKVKKQSIKMLYFVMCYSPVSLFMMDWGKQMKAATTP